MNLNNMNIPISLWKVSKRCTVIFLIIFILLELECYFIAVQFSATDTFNQILLTKKNIILMICLNLRFWDLVISLYKRSQSHLLPILYS
jgi:hypothetical protein